MKALTRDDERTFRNVLWFNSALPAALLAGDYARGLLGANPAEALTRTTGVLTLIFLGLTLLTTPLATKLKFPALVRQRRAIGLTAFFYGVAHLGTYIGFDRGFDLASVPADIVKRPFILVGMLAFILMAPLAATSTNAMIRRMGPKAWKRLHRATYAVAVLGVIHFTLIVKSDVTWPIYFGVVVALLLAMRLRRVRQALGV